MVNWHADLGKDSAVVRFGSVVQIRVSKAIIIACRFLWFRCGVNNRNVIPERNIGLEIQLQFTMAVRENSSATVQGVCRVQPAIDHDIAVTLNGQ